VKWVWFYTCITRLTVTVKVEPADVEGLRRSFETANGAGDGIREQAWHPKTFRESDFRCRSCGHQARADINAAENIRQGRCREVERDVVQNRLSHSFRFRRLSAAVTGPRLLARVVYSPF
jgi:hypothetical protein